MAWSGGDNSCTLLSGNSLKTARFRLARVLKHATTNTAAFKITRIYFKITQIIIKKINKGKNIFHIKIHLNYYFKIDYEQKKNVKEGFASCRRCFVFFL